jgi:hypothetical protein
MDIRELIQKSVEAEQAGVPVNWKELCVTAVTVATQRVGQLEKELQQYTTVEATEETDTID